MGQTVDQCGPARGRSGRVETEQRKDAVDVDEQQGLA
jgi:hypothetical protein